MDDNANDDETTVVDAAEESDRGDNIDDETHVGQRESAKQRHLRSAIVAVHRNTALSRDERQRRIRALMLDAHGHRPQQSGDARAAPPPLPDAFLMRALTKNDDATTIGIHTNLKVCFGCEHYARDCVLLSPCCNRWFVCRLCHDADPPTDCPQRGEPLERRKVETVACCLCRCVQPFAAQCRECGHVFGEYVCEECRFFDHDGRIKGIEHCDGCGVCNVYPNGRDKWRHCERCNACVPVETEHKCAPQAMQSTCPICAESLRESVRPVVFLHRCGHAIHEDCADRHRRTSIRCPLCAKSMFDDATLRELWQEYAAVLAVSPMPCAFATHRVDILCNDCEVNTDNLPFHFVAHRCAQCGGYNTVVTRNTNGGASTLAGNTTDD